MTITLDPETLDRIIRRGLIDSGTMPSELIKKAKIKVYRKGTKIAAKIILE